MTGLKTSYDFTLPRGYVDHEGRLHKTGTMRLATARDELDPLRDPGVSGPDDPRLTILVLARVVERLGDRELVTALDIENLFAVDLAYLQDFYGVINFGSQQEYDELLRSQNETALLGSGNGRPVPAAEPVRADSGGFDGGDAFDAGDAGAGEDAEPRPRVRAAVEEIRRQSS